MSLPVGNFSLQASIPLGPGARLVATRITGPTSYASAGEPLSGSVITNALGGGRVIAAICEPFINTSTGAQVSLTWDPASAVAGSTQGKFIARNSVGAHAHNFIVSGGVTSSGNIFLGVGLGSSAPVLGRQDTSQTLVPGGANVQDNTAVVAGSQLAAGTNLSSYIANVWLLLEG